MVHAYEYVRCHKHARRRGDCHDEYFSTSIDAVHKRAVRILGISAISRREQYQQAFRFGSAVDDTYINNSYSKYGSTRHDALYRHDHGSNRHDKGRRDERGGTRSGARGSSRGEAGCSVM